LERPALRIGIALLDFGDDRIIWFNGFPFLDNKEEHSFGVPVSAVMIRDLVLLPSVGIKLDEVESILSETDFGGFPVVQDRDSKILLGYIGRTELKYAIGTRSLFTG
jgi:chloride channel 3/4/5